MVNPLLDGFKLAQLINYVEGLKRGLEAGKIPSATRTKTIENIIEGQNAIKKRYELLKNMEGKFNMNAWCSYLQYEIGLPVKIKGTDMVGKIFPTPHDRYELARTVLVSFGTKYERYYPEEIEVILPPKIFELVY